MDLLKIILVILIIFLLYKIYKNDTNIIEGHLGYPDTGGMALEHTFSSCIDEATGVEITDPTLCSPGPDTTQSGGTSARNIINNFHIGDSVLAQFKYENINTAFGDWLFLANQASHKATVDSWSTPGVLLLAVVVGIHNTKNLILVQFTLGNVGISYDSQTGLSHTEQHWVTPGAPGLNRNSNSDVWKNFHVSLYPEEEASLGNDWINATPTWTSELSGFAYDMNGGVVLDTTTSTNKEYGGVIHYNNIIDSKITIRDNIKNITGVSPTTVNNCIIAQGNESIDQNYPGRCKLYIDQPPSGNGSQTCLSIENERADNLNIGDKYSIKCDTCSKPDITNTTSTGPVEFVIQGGMPPDKVPFNDIDCTLVSGTCPIGCISTPDTCTITPGTDTEETTTPTTCSEPSPTGTCTVASGSGSCAYSSATCQPEHTWGEDNHPYSVRCAPGFRSTGGILTQKCTVPDSGSNDYEHPTEGTTILSNNPTDKCLPVDTCLSPLTISDSDSDPTAAAARTNLALYSQIDEGPYNSFLEMGSNFQVTAKCAPGLFNSMNTDTTVADVTPCTDNGTHYTLSGCDTESPCNNNRGSTSGEVCIFDQTQCTALINSGQSNDVAYDNDACTRNFIKSTGFWNDINDDGDYGCDNTCNTLGGIMNKKKLMIWEENISGEKETSEAFKDGIQSYTTESTSEEDKIEILRDIGGISTKLYLLKGDVIKPGDIRIGYYGKLMDDTDLTAKNVSASNNPTEENRFKIGTFANVIDFSNTQHGQSGIITGIVDNNVTLILNGGTTATSFEKNQLEDANRWHYIDCDKASSTQCETAENTCEYSVCSKHCVSEWQPANVDWELLNSNSKLYGFNEKDNKPWGPCTKKDGSNTCGTGIQATMATISRDESNGGKCFFPEKRCNALNPNNSTMCDIKDQDDCDTDPLCIWSNKLLTNNTPDRYEYRKCRGDGGVGSTPWITCAGILRQYVEPDGGFAEMKQFFIDMANYMVTPSAGPSTHTAAVLAGTASLCTPSTITTETAFWSMGQSRINTMNSSIVLEDATTIQEKKDKLLEYINYLNQLQLDYINNDERILANGERVQGLNEQPVLTRFETNIPQEIYTFISQTSDSIDSNIVQRLVTSMPVGGSITKIDWYKLFCIRIIYILELINLITIERIETIKNQLMTDDPLRLCDKYLIDYNYIIQNYTNQTQTQTPVNIGVSKGDWDIYPFQWMYGGENRTGLNSDSESDVILYFLKLIKVFYNPCVTPDSGESVPHEELDPMEQYIRFNLNLYRHVQINTELIHHCESKKQQSYDIFRENNEYCNENLKYCGINDDYYPSWFTNYMAECNEDITKCHLNNVGEYSMPQSIREQIDLYKCDIGTLDGASSPSTGACCNLENRTSGCVGGQCTESEQCNRPLSYSERLTSRVIDSNTSSHIYSSPTNTVYQKSFKMNQDFIAGTSVDGGISQQYISNTLGNLNDLGINCNIQPTCTGTSDGATPPAQCSLNADLSGCAVVGGDCVYNSSDISQCNTMSNCVVEGDKCVFAPDTSMISQKLHGTASLKKNYDLTGDKWNEWLYKLENGATSSRTDYDNHQPSWAANTKWNDGTDWTPGEQIDTTPNNPAWENKVTVEGDLQSIEDYGIQKKTEGVSERYKEGYCTQWPNESICTDINILSSEIATIEANITAKNAEIAAARINNIPLRVVEGQLMNTITSLGEDVSLLLDDINLLSTRPAQCEECDPCINCKTCPAQEAYSTAKGICPPCSCSKEITEINTQLNEKCDASLNERRALLERRNIDTIESLRVEHKKELDEKNMIIKDSNKEIEESQSRGAVCKEEEGMFTVRQTSNSAEFLRLVEENERLLKEHTTEKNKSWFEKLIF